MPAAARQGDLIGHAPPIPPVVAAAVAGGAVASGAANSIGGKLTSVALAGADAASGSGGGGGGVGGVVTGLIVPQCSGNVFTNGIPAARALIDKAACSLHPPVPLPIVSGSSNVFINGVPAARLGDKIFCGAVILTASGNVFIGGSAGAETVATDMAMPEGLISPLMLESLLMADTNCASITSRLFENFVNWAGAEGQLNESATSERFLLEQFDNPITGRKNRLLAQASLDATEERMGALEKKGFNLSTREQLEYAKLSSRRNAQAGAVDQIDRQLRQVTPFSDWTPAEWHRTNESALMTMGALGAAKTLGSRPRNSSGDIARTQRFLGERAGIRNTELLTAEQQSQLYRHVEELGLNPKDFQISNVTSYYSDNWDYVALGPNTFPAKTRTARTVFETMSPKATVAHEAGHMLSTRAGTSFEAGSLFDEVNASMIGRKLPGLSSVERYQLLRDAAERARIEGRSLGDVLQDMEKR